jgi:enoyl-CoA hydratase/carnithine racemase
MLLLAETPTAEDLSDTGFFYQICPADQLDQVCEQLINTIRALSPTTLKVTKLAMRGAHQSLLPNADDLIRECYGSANFREGVSAFLAKRPAQWRTE